jgi:hypothetical protein
LVDKTTGQIPQGNSTKVRSVLVLTDQVLQRNRIDVATFVGLLDGRQTNVQLCRLALRAAGNHGFPVVIVELVTRRVASDGITCRVVVELDEELVKGSLSDQILQVKVSRASGTLRSSGDDQC